MTHVQVISSPHIANTAFSLLAVWGCVVMLAIVLQIPELAERHHRLGRRAAIAALLVVGVDVTRQLVTGGGLTAVELDWVSLAAVAVFVVGLGVMATNWSGVIRRR